MESAKRVLLVEDNPGDARLLNEALLEVQPAPFALVHVDRFIAAIEPLNRETFSAVLLELSLPDPKGLDTVVRIRREADFLFINLSQITANPPKSIQIIPAR